MEGVEFQEEDATADMLRTMQAHKSPQKTGLITRTAISTGLAKDTQSAQYVLLVVAILLLLATLVLFLAGKRHSSVPASPALIQADLNRTP